LLQTDSDVLEPFSVAKKVRELERKVKNEQEFYLKDKDRAAKEKRDREANEVPVEIQFK
jgi:hypothetical protein